MDQPPRPRSFEPGQPHHRGVLADVPLKLGEVLVSRGVLTAPQVAHLLDVQAAVGRPFGDLAERLYGVDPRDVADAWVRQFAQQTRERDVSRERVDPAWLSLLSARQAWQFRMVPLRREWDHLTVAADARGLVKAVNYASATFPLSCCFALAEPASLRKLLMRHYPVAASLADYAFAR